MIVVEIVEGQAAKRVVEWDRPTASVPYISIGRGDGNHLVVTDYHLSTDHGQIFTENGKYIYRDLRSTNGSAIRRGQERLAIDATCHYECALRDGDHLLLGDPAVPVVIKLRISEQGTIDADGGRVLASRRLAELGLVEGEVEKDPARLRAVFAASRRITGRVDLGESLHAIADASFELIPGATHICILLRGDTDADRFSVALSRAKVRPPAGVEGSSPTVLPSRSILKRVLEERAALIVANALEEFGGSESVMGGGILSTLAVPLWQEGEIRGVIQLDNRAAPGMFKGWDLEAMLVLGGQAALALENARLVSRLRVAEERLSGENLYLKGREQKRRFADIIGEAPSMKAVLRQLEKVIDTRATVCVEGETGTGKELIASAVHYQSRRKDKLFVPQNCAAMPETLLESELFGHKKGAFTGADQDKKGLFELADQGTLFLDEIGEMAVGLQAKLLRVLQEGTIRPVGATAERQVDVRIICATNRDLAAEVEKGAFRQDLYYRLMVFPIRLPALRERRDDIPMLARFFLEKYTSEYRKNITGIAQPAMDALVVYPWPGNIRELENEIQRVVIQSEPDGFIEVEHLSPRIKKVSGTVERIAPKKGTLKEMMEHVERHLLSEALRDHDNNKTKTAETLGITREGLHKKLAKFGM